MTNREQRATVTRRRLRGFEAARLSSRRRELQFTRGELGRLADLSAGTITAWEQGVRTPQADTLARVAAVLEVPVEWLVRVPRDQRFIGDLRVLQGWTQLQLATQIGVSTATLSAVERGETRPTPRTTDALAQALQASPEEVYRAWQRARSRPARTPA